MTKRIALYARVSTDGQTVENQLEELREVAKRHGWEIVHVFADRGISGTKGRDERPAFNKLLESVARKEVDMVAVGFWQNLYKGDYGRVATGLQYEYIRRKSFDGVPGPVSTSDNVVLSSLRYYPF